MPPLHAFKPAIYLQLAMGKRRQSEQPKEEQASGVQTIESGEETSDSEEDPPIGSESEEESEDDEDGEAFDSIDVDFEFYDARERDFHGLKTLLNGLLDGEEWSCSELVDAVLAQVQRCMRAHAAGLSGRAGTWAHTCVRCHALQSAEACVGTVIKCGEEDDPIGVATVLSLPHHSGKLQSLRQLRAFLERHCPDAASRERLGAAWDAPGTGLVLNERLINSPPQLAPPLQEMLFREVQEAAGDEDLPAETRKAFRFQQYLMVVRAYTDPTSQQQQQQQPNTSLQPPHLAQNGSAASGSGASGSKQGSKKRQKGGASGGDHAQGSALVHVLPEAECYQQRADWAFSFPTPRRLVAKDELQQCRLVMLVKASAVPAAQRQLAALLGGLSS